MDGNFCRKMTKRFKKGRKNFIKFQKKLKTPKNDFIC